MWDLNQYESQNEGLKPITQMLEVVSAEVKSTNSGNGEYINVLIKSLSDSGASFFKFNIVNQNKKAVDIGMGQIKSILTSSGVTNLAFRSQYDIAEKLVGCQFAATVVEKEKDGYVNQSLTKFKKLEGKNFDHSPKTDTNVPF